LHLLLLPKTWILSTKQRNIKVRESKAGVLLAHKNVAITLAEIEIHFKREENMKLALQSIWKKTSK
jgi:hypothetical protein